MYKLTIVVAIYNVENYLKKCLDSLVDQTCGDYQVFCVNDGSTDKSRDIILSYLDNKKFKLLDKPNGGLSDARNYGIERCNSEYISFIDGDDFVENNYVETIINTLEKDKSDMMVFSYNQYYLANGNKELVGLRFENGVYNLKDKKELLAYTPNAAWNKAYKTSLFKDNKILYPYGYRHQDMGTTPKLLLKANSISYVDKPLYNYLIDRPNNITAQIDKKLYHIIDMAKEVMDYYIKEKCFDEYVDEFAYLIKRNFIQSLRKSMKLQDKKFVYQFIDDIFDVEDKYFKNSKDIYHVNEEKGDDVYLSRIKCKLYYALKRLKNGK